MMNLRELEARKGHAIRKMREARQKEAAAVNNADMSACLAAIRRRIRGQNELAELRAQLKLEALEVGR